MVKDNNNTISIVINNTQSPPLNEIKTKNDRLNILVVQKSDNNIINNLMHFFQYFIYKKAAFRYSLEDALNRPKIKISLFNLNNILIKLREENINGLYYKDSEKKRVKNGLGFLYYANKNIAFCGQIENGARNGQGKLYSKDGSITFEGNWENNKAEGYGKMYYVNGNFVICCEGNWKDNAAEGKGKIFLNGNIYYKGDFVNGRMEGKGKMHFESKDKYVDYEGQFENCFWHGEGTRYYKSDGEYSKIWYHGDYKNGKENGRGIFINDQNGEYYVGEFRDGLPHGEGIWYNSDGTIIHKGNFKEGYIDGDNMINNN